MEARQQRSATLLFWWSFLNRHFGVLRAEMNMSTNMSAALPLLAQCDSGIGLQSFIMPVIGPGKIHPVDHLPYSIIMDLAFRSHYDPGARATYGEPEGYWKIPTFHPCLRSGIKIVPDSDSPKMAIHQQNHFFLLRQGHGHPNLSQSNRSLVHTAWYGLQQMVHSPAGLQADSFEIVHASTNFAEVTFNREVYPNFFRVQGAMSWAFQPMWGFYKLYAWRELVIMYTSDVRQKPFLEMWIHAFSADGVPPAFIRAIPLNSQVPFQLDALRSQIRSIRDLPIRLLSHQVSTIHDTTSEEAFLDIVIKIQIEQGLWFPTYQLIVQDEFLQAGYFTKNSTNYANLGKTSYGSAVTPNAWFMAPAIFGTLIPGFMWWMGKVGTIGAVDLKSKTWQEHYGLNKWPSSDLLSLLEKLDNAGGLVAMLFSYEIATTTYAWYQSDYAMRQLFAQDCFLHRGGHVAVRNTSLFRQCLISESQKLEHFTFPTGYSSAAQEVEVPYTLFCFIYVEETQVTHHPIIYTEGSNFMEGFSKAVVEYPPVWGNGDQSHNVPEELLNCTPGMMKSIVGDFANCAWCPAGRFSRKYDSEVCDPCAPGTFSPGRAAKCEPCGPGSEARESGSHSCTTCVNGTFSKGVTNVACEFCPIGAFSDVSGATACKQCKTALTSLTTENIGSRGPSDCVCPRGQYISKNKCVDCMQGLACGEGWPHNWATSGGMVVLNENYYSLESAPYETYFCQTSDGRCPGGALQPRCNDGLVGLLCSKCAKSGYRIVNGACEPCPPYLKMMMFFIILGCLVIVVAAFYLSNAALAVNAGHKQDIAVFVGLAITVFQIFGVLKGLEVQWPIDLYDFMDTSSSVFTLDVQRFSFTCAVGDQAVAQYLVQALTPYLLMAMVAALGIASRVMAAWVGNDGIAWAFSKCLNVVGQVLQALFIAFCGIMVRPLQCFDHPNGKKSVVMFPEVLCWESNDHTVLTIIATGILLFFILPFIAWCVWGCWKAPVKSSEKDAAFLESFRFLFYRFRPDCWWWGLVFLVRQTCLAFSTVVPSSNAHAQLFYIGGILAIYVSFAAMFWPWISTELSIVDSGSCIVLILLLICSSQFLPSASEVGSVSLLIILFMTLACVICRYLVIFVMSVWSSGLDEEICGETPNRLDLCQQWFEFLHAMKYQSTNDTIETLCKMNTFDRYRVLSLMHLWSANGNLGVAGGKTPPRLSNIRSRTSLDEDAIGTAGTRVSQIATDSSHLAKLADSLGLEDIGHLQNVIEQKVHRP